MLKSVLRLMIIFYTVVNSRMCKPDHLLGKSNLRRRHAEEPVQSDHVILENQSTEQRLPRDVT